MGILKGMDSDVYVTSPPSVTIGSPESCPNSDAGAYVRYRAATHHYWDKYYPLTVQVRQNEVQTLTITGSPTGGTVKLAFNGQTMAGTLNWNATASDVHTALEGLSSIGSGNLTCAGGPWPATPITAEFTNTHALEDEPLITLNTNGLTGGTSPNMTIVETLKGGPWYTINSGYDFEYPGGYVVFSIPHIASTEVQITAGYYFPIAQLANCSAWEMSMKTNIIDTSIFQMDSWGSSQAAMKTASGKISSFLSDDTLDDQLSELMVFALYLDKSADLRYECYGWVTELAPKASMSGVITKDVSFDVDGQVYYRTTA